MTVKELIDLLNTFNPEAEVSISDESGTSVLHAHEVWQTESEASVVIDPYTEEDY